MMQGPGVPKASIRMPRPTVLATLPSFNLLNASPCPWADVPIILATLLLADAVLHVQIVFIAVSLFIAAKPPQADLSDRNRPARRALWRGHDVVESALCGSQGCDEARWEVIGHQQAVLEAVVLHNVLTHVFQEGLVVFVAAPNAAGVVLLGR